MITIKSINHKCISFVKKKEESEKKKKEKKYSYFIDLIKKHSMERSNILDYVRMIMHDATLLAEILSKRLIDEFIEILKIFFAAQSY